MGWQTLEVTCGRGGTSEHHTALHLGFNLPLFFLLYTFCNMHVTFLYVLFLGRFTEMGLTSSSSSAAASPPEDLGCLNSVSTLLKGSQRLASSW